MHIKLNQPLGMEYTWARQMVACTARAYGLEAIDCPYVNVYDLDGLKVDSEYSSNIGYTGRLAVHPSQVQSINQSYSPSEDTIRLAKEIVEVFETEALPKGQASIMYKGHMIATAVYKNAKGILSNRERP